jgi:acetolactate synthase regulatory subunit
MLIDPIAAQLVHCIGVTAHADPGALARILEPVAKLGLVPVAVHARLFAESGEMVVDLQIAGISADLCNSIASKIAAMPVTLRVVTG